MKTFILFCTFSVFTISVSYSQSSKFRFDIDGATYLDIRKNAGDFYRIHQNNTQTSMFFGFNSGIKNIIDPSIFGSGDLNTAYGFATLSENTTGFRNTAIGSLALTNNITGSTNVAIGFSALSDNTTAIGNIGIGKSALRSNMEGEDNVAIGTDAFNNTNYAYQSIAIGATAGVNDTSSVNNVYVGFGAGRGTPLATDGYDRSYNTMIGSQSGYLCKTEGNVFLGNQAGMNAKADNQLYISNSGTDSLNTLIYGHFDNEFVRINGKLNIDGNYTLPTTSPSNGQYLGYNGGPNLGWGNIDAPWSIEAGDDVVYEDGDVGIGIGDPVYRLDVSDNLSTSYVARFQNTNTTTSSKGIIIQTGPTVNPGSTVYYAAFLDGNGTNIGGIRGDGSGGTMYSTTSDRRLKQNIKTYEKGLETIRKINPTTYQMKSNPDRDEIGFIAQELIKVLPQAVSGHPSDDIEESPMMVDYSKITPVLVAAIQEQQVLIDNQKVLLNQLIKKLDSQAKVTDNLSAEVAQLKGIANLSRRD